jgi:guanylate cyclase
MVAYISLLVASLIIQPAMTNDNNLSETVVGALFIVNIFGIAVFTFIVMNYFVGQREMMQAALQREQEKSDNLLLNILPREVAADLKERGGTQARYYQSASVLFADQVGFTEFSGRTSPEDIVSTLNEIFTSFDEIVSRRDVEKIRTIGDAYMAAAGVPIEWEEHATAIVDAALDMQGFINTCDGIQFRIGVSSGPLVGGVVGTSKFQYDIWGNTVNVASRMESSGQPGRIQISDATYQLIKDEFECELRGEIEVKGKGVMTTWFVVERSN